MSVYRTIGPQFVVVTNLSKIDEDRGVTSMNYTHAKHRLGGHCSVISRVPDSLIKVAGWNLSCGAVLRP